MAAKYQLIARELEQLILGYGKEKLPTEASLCERFHCSRQTVRSALKLLEDSGKIIRRQGSGSFSAQTTRNREIAVILANREEYTSPALIAEIRKSSEEAGFTAVCYETKGRRTKEREYLADLLLRRPAGILLEPISDLQGCFCTDLLSRLRQTGIPVVYLRNHYSSVPFSAVSMQYAAGAGTLLAHLAVHGHKHIAAVLKSDETSSMETFRGCTESAALLGISFAEDNCMWLSEQERRLLLEGDSTMLRRFVQVYLNGCTAVICGNDEIAYRLKKYLSEQKLQTACVSFDNSYLARDAQLTSLACEGDSLGKTAVRMLLQNTSESVFLPWRLIVRK